MTERRERNQREQIGMMSLFSDPLAELLQAVGDEQSVAERMEGRRSYRTTAMDREKRVMEEALDKPKVLRSSSGPNKLGLKSKATSSPSSLGRDANNGFQTFVQDSHEHPEALDALMHEVSQGKVAVSGASSVGFSSSSSSPSSSAAQTHFQASSTAPHHVAALAAALSASSANSSILSMGSSPTGHTTTAPMASAAAQATHSGAAAGPSQQQQQGSQSSASPASLQDAFRRLHDSSPSPLPYAFYGLHPSLPAPATSGLVGHSAFAMVSPLLRLSASGASGSSTSSQQGSSTSGSPSPLASSASLHSHMDCDPSYTIIGRAPKRIDSGGAPLAFTPSTSAVPNAQQASLASQSHTSFPALLQQHLQLQQQHLQAQHSLLQSLQALNQHSLFAGSILSPPGSPVPLSSSPTSNGHHLAAAAASSSSSSSSSMLASPNSPTSSLVLPTMASLQSSLLQPHHHHHHHHHAHPADTSHYSCSSSSHGSAPHSPCGSDEDSTATVALKEQISSHSTRSSSSAMDIASSPSSASSLHHTSHSMFHSDRPSAASASSILASHFLDAALAAEASDCHDSESLSSSSSMDTVGLGSPSSSSSAADPNQVQQLAARFHYPSSATHHSPAFQPGCGQYSEYIHDLRTVCTQCSASGRLKSKKKPLVDSLLLLAFFGDGIKKTANGNGYIIEDSNLARELMNSVSTHIRPPSRGTNNSYDNWKRAMGKTFRKSGTYFTPKDEDTARYARHVEEHLVRIFERKKLQNGGVAPSMAMMVSAVDSATPSSSQSSSSSSLVH